jgi:hypothetical protein
VLKRRARFQPRHACAVAGEEIECPHQTRLIARSGAETGVAACVIFNANSDGYTMSSARNIMATLVKCGTARCTPILIMGITSLLVLSGGRAADNGSNRNPVVVVDVPNVTLPVRTDIWFSATASDPDGDPVGVTWNFGSGEADASGSSILHRFVQGGMRTITCTAKDTRGGMAVQSFTVNVDDPLASWFGHLQSRGALHGVAADSREVIAVGVGFIGGDPAVPFRTLHLGPNETYWDVATDGADHFIAVGRRQDAATTPSSPIMTEVFSRKATLLSPPANTASDFTSVAYGGGRYVVVGTGGLMLQSSDFGATWSPVVTHTTQDFRRVRYENGRFVAMTLYGTMLTSNNGLTWATTSLDGAFFDLTYFRNMWVAVGPRSAYVSSDGARWQPRALPSERISFCRSLGDLLLASDQARPVIYLSEDGTNWFSLPFVTTEPRNDRITAACVSGDTVFATTSGGVFLKTALKSKAGIPPRLTPKLHDLFLPAGQSFTLVSGVSGANLSYQWQKDGVDLPGATTSTLVFPSLQPGDGGVYVLKAANYGGTVTTDPVTLVAEANTARLINLSVLARAGRDADTLAVGIVTKGAPFTSRSPYAISTFGKQLVFRAIGPTLAQFGVDDALNDPRIDLYRNSRRFDGNDDWAVTSAGANWLTAVFDFVGAFRLPSNSKDAAFGGEFSIGANTVEVTSPNPTVGIVLAEVYDVDRRVEAGRLVNLSSRCRLRAADDTMMAGFTIAGGGQCTLLIRAVGPTLGALGVSGAMPDPILRLLSGTTVIAENDNWSNDPAILTAASSTGAFPLAAGSRDAAVLVRLGAGSYVAQVNGAGASSGVILVEIYEVR